MHIMYIYLHVERVQTLIAALAFFRDVRIVDSKTLNLPISCTSTVFMLCSYLVGYFCWASTKSKLDGRFDKISEATVSIISSVDWTPLPETRAYTKEKTVHRANKVFCNWLKDHLHSNVSGLNQVQISTLCDMGNSHHSPFALFVQCNTMFITLYLYD